VSTEPAERRVGTSGRDKPMAARVRLLLLAAAAIYYLAYVWRLSSSVTGGTRYFLLADDQGQEAGVRRPGPSATRAMSAMRRGLSTSDLSALHSRPDFVRHFPPSACLTSRAFPAKL
jgi:hypothetical protein